MNYPKCPICGEEMSWEKLIQVKGVWYHYDCLTDNTRIEPTKVKP
jgi:hypothetical protein